MALRNAEAQARDARLAARQNLTAQMRSLQNAMARIEVQMAAIAAAEEDLRVQQQRYALGASTLLDLLTSQTTLNQARQALIQARLDSRLARAQLSAPVGREMSAEAFHSAGGDYICRVSPLRMADEQRPPSPSPEAGSSAESSPDVKPPDEPSRRSAEPLATPPARCRNRARSMP